SGPMLAPTGALFMLDLHRISEVVQFFGDPTWFLVLIPAAAFLWMVSMASRRRNQARSLRRHHRSELQCPRCDSGILVRVRIRRVPEFLAYMLRGEIRACDFCDSRFIFFRRFSAPLIQVKAEDERSLPIVWRTLCGAAVCIA